MKFNLRCSVPFVAFADFVVSNVCAGQGFPQKPTTDSLTTFGASHPSGSDPRAESFHQAVRPVIRGLTNERLISGEVFADPRRWDAGIGRHRTNAKPRDCFRRAWYALLCVNESITCRSIS
ncbi:hypothetical protein Q31b_05510 [Novipirellula aureliae]|uniref:Uncharacterized protein n=1 Tax=Novipirellula aureliae TaxID=2527966 RepID=A0A5C6EDT1_9BACT|nr:hypothetical protein Q31b_05510 [Novipirellula aureliae]